MFLGLTVLVVVAAGLGTGNGSESAIRCIVCWIKQIPLTGDVYGYYGQEVKVKENLNERNLFPDGGFLCR